MPWTDPSAAIGVDKPIRASTHLALFQNFLALAAGEPGAPRVQIPQAVATTETDTGKVLTPDGAGGVTWGSVAGSIAAGRRVSYDGGSPTTTIPTGPAIYVLSASARNTVYHNIVLPNPNAALAGHIALIVANNTGTYGGGRIRLGSAGGTILHQWNDGSGWSGVMACDGQQWVTVAE